MEALALVVVPVGVPEALGLPLHSEHVAVPQWWRDSHGPGVVLSYPFPTPLIQSPLSWQANGAFGVALVGGTGPQGTLARAGTDRAATALLTSLSERVVGRPIPSAGNVGVLRAMIVRDGVTEVVVPVALHGSALVTGSPSLGAAAFFTETLGIAPVLTDGAWVFTITPPLPLARIASPQRYATCTALFSAPSGAALATCLYGRTR